MTVHDFIDGCVAYDGDAEADEYACGDKREQNSCVPKLFARYQCTNCIDDHKDTSNSGRCDNASILE